MAEVDAVEAAERDRAFARRHLGQVWRTITAPPPAAGARREARRPPAARRRRQARDAMLADAAARGRGRCRAARSRQRAGGQVRQRVGGGAYQCPYGSAGPGPASRRRPPRTRPPVSAQLQAVRAGAGRPPGRRRAGGCRCPSSTRPRSRALRGRVEPLDFQPVDLTRLGGGATASPRRMRAYARSPSTLTAEAAGTACSISPTSGTAAALTALASDCGPAGVISPSGSSVVETAPNCTTAA